MYINKSIIIAFLVGIIFSGTGCNNNKTERQISEIDSLLSLANALNNNIDSIPLDSVEGFYKFILDQNKVFKVKLNGLPENIEVRNMLFAYGNVEKGFKKLPPKLKSLISEIETSIDQLDNLKFDLSNKLLEEGEYKDYISDEKEILERLKTETIQTCTILKKHIKDYFILKPEVEVFLDSLINTEDKI